MTLKQFVQVPAGFAERWEVVFQPGLRHEHKAKASALSRPMTYNEAMTRLQYRRMGLEANGASFLPSLNWAHTWEGVRGRETFSLFIRPHVESAN